jgi:hypothetical protein
MDEYEIGIVKLEFGEVPAHRFIGVIGLLVVVEAQRPRRRFRCGCYLAVRGLIELTWGRAIRSSVISCAGLAADRMLRA